MFVCLSTTPENDTDNAQKSESGDVCLCKQSNVFCQPDDRNDNEFKIFRPMGLESESAKIDYSLMTMMNEFKALAMC